MKKKVEATVKNSKLGVSSPSKETSIGKRIKRHWQLYLVFLVPLVLVICFSYVPMYGIIIAFKDYMANKGIWGSDWIGLKHFTSFFGSYNFSRLLGNTLGISAYSIIAGFPIPILLAIALNECRNVRYKKTVQMVTYAPYFISTVVLVSMLTLILAPKTGLVNNFLAALNMERIDFIAVPSMFKSIYVWSGVWQGMGFSAIIYIAALSGIDPSLHEAAVVDGATKLKRIWHIDLPGIMPTIIITLILSTGSIMNVGYEKVFLMQNPANMPTSDVISTYVYRIGLINSQYSLSTAVGLFNSVVNLILLVTVNAIARKVGDTSLW